MRHRVSVRDLHLLLDRFLVAVDSGGTGVVEALSEGDPFRFRQMA